MQKAEGAGAPATAPTYRDATGTHFVNLHGPTTVHLFDPVQDIDHEGRKVAELVLQPLLAKHLRSFPAQGQTLGDTLNLAGEMAGQPPHIIDQLGMPDVNALSEIVQAHLTFSPATGPSA